MLSTLPVTVFNPRRDDFDKTLRQDITEPKFKEQVDWETKYLQEATVIALYLQVGTISPISLLELGRYAESRKVIVCCPDGFHRKDNVQITCHDHGIPLIETKEEFDRVIMEQMERLCQTGPVARGTAMFFSGASKLLSWMSKEFLQRERQFLGWNY